MVLVHAVLIETHGKQSYIFATGKRREAVGASHLVDAVTRWAEKAIEPAGSIAAGAGAELVVATSGTVLAFVTDRQRGVDLVRVVTRRALREAPGLWVTGVVGDPFEWDSGAAPDAVAAVFRRMGEVRYEQPGPSARFPASPLTELCPSSGLPVSGLVRIGGELEPRSAPSLAKLSAVTSAVTRLSDLSGIDEHQIWRATERLAGDGADAPERVAVVHADGNGLGGLVTRLASLIERQPGEGPDTGYARGYREFSQALERTAVNAFGHAVIEFFDVDERFPLVLPLIVGGDDLTFLADAADAPALTALVLHRFVEYAAAEPAIAGPVARASEVDDPRLGMAAGIVVTGPHFPFSAAYSLSKELLSEVAKTAKTRVVDVEDRPIPCISVACHVQTDTIGTTNAQRVADLTASSRVLTGAPYVALVPAGDVVRTLSAATEGWLRGRDLRADLFAVARAFSETTDGRRVRPSAQVHELRRRLRPDPAAADEYLRRLTEADEKRWVFLHEGRPGSPPTLFADRDGEPPSTRFLDALTLAPFAGPPLEGVTA